VLGLAVLRLGLRIMAPIQIVFPLWLPCSSSHKPLAMVIREKAQQLQSVAYWDNLNRCMCEEKVVGKGLSRRHPFRR
jgi:hypothetical protein